MFLLIAERVNWIASAPEGVSSWVLVKLLRNRLPLRWCRVWRCCWAALRVRGGQRRSLEAAGKVSVCDFILLCVVCFA